MKIDHYDEKRDGLGETKTTFSENDKKMDSLGRRATTFSRE